MSFDLLEVHRLKTAGGQVWDEYCRLVAACDASAYDSPAHKALGEFQQQCEQDPNLLAEKVRNLNAKRAAVAEAAARNP